MYGLIIAVAHYEDLKLKYYEEMDKRKKLYNIVQETKGIYYPMKPCNYNMLLAAIMLSYCLPPWRSQTYHL
jgi:hypothetical protein